MKKNKTIAYLMAATLLVGGTFLGTKALFIDKEDVVGELKISTGDVDLGVETAEDWSLNRNGDEESEGSDPAHSQVGDFDNLKTGDILTKKVTITNQGTLTAIVDLEQNPVVVNKISDAFKYTAKVTQGETTVGNDNINMAPGSSITVDLSIEVVGGGMHNNKDNQGSINTDKQEASPIELEGTYVVNAKQQDKRPSVGE